MKKYEVEVTIKRTVVIEADPDGDLCLEDQIHEAAESECEMTFVYDAEMEVVCFEAV